MKLTSDSTHGQLRPRHIQLIDIGGTIRTALYVQIGRGLLDGGPGSLFLAFTIWYVTTLDGLLNQEHGEIYMLLPPQSNPFQKLKISCNSS